MILFFNKSTWEINLHSLEGQLESCVCMKKWILGIWQYSENYIVSAECRRRIFENICTAGSMLTYPVQFKAESSTLNLVTSSKLSSVFHKDTPYFYIC